MSKLLATCLGLLACLTPAAMAQTTTDPLDATAIRQLEDYLGLPAIETPAAVELRDRIWRETAIAHGALEPLLRELQTRLRRNAAATEPSRADELRLRRLLAHYQRRLGETNQARRSLDAIKETEETLADSLNKAEVLDALGHNKAAIAVYDRLLRRPIDDRLRNRILLRQALMSDARARPDTGDKTADSPLAIFSRSDKLSAELRNQAAMVLALTGEQAAAIEAFVPSGEGSARFRQELRNAEWAIEAKALPRAQTAAWNAVRFAKLRRDRRYALAVLVEAYRRAGKLGILIERLAGSPNLDAESRQVWIDLLRERGDVEAALKLFREAKDGEFSADMRRELLEICRETNQDQTLEDAYRGLITAEPRFLEWRKGLTSFYLERGRREAATAVWRDYAKTTTDIRYRMAAAATLTELGLDELAMEFARNCMAEGDLKAKQSALLFLFELHLGRGRHQAATEILAELDHLAPANGPVRKELADAYERLGDLDKSVAILIGLQSTLGEAMPPNTLMKLTLMLSKVGKEEQALQQWRTLWLRTKSIPRRRYVEERLMAVASRLGKLARMAIELEKKLIAGTADDREAGLLVRLYIKVNDPVSATEIIEEHMRRTGKKPIDVLTEKARVFQSCQDYYNYELVIQQLVKIDPEGRPDYLRQLAMSMMERGQRKQAREVLEQLKADRSDAVSDEFEAGVLALAGMRPEALRSYRRGIARSPERIDSYLLLSNMQRTLGLHNRSAGMFQFLAAKAERDDLFTIAVDGILNMRATRSNAGVPDRLVEWTRRLVFERLASRPDKLYLYRLIADLSEELNDSATAIRALKSAVPVAGEQRTQMLRELMAMAKKAAGGNTRPSYRILPSGVAVPTAPPQRSNPDLLMFGRRILGQAEMVPPDVYIELGAAFLAAGEVGNAILTFNQASRLPEFAEMRRRMAQTFETAGYPDEALRVYERILSIENRDVELITKVAELREQTGSDAVALDLYRRGLDLLLDRSVFAITGSKDQQPATAANPLVFSMANRNSNSWDRQHSWLVGGLLATLDQTTVLGFLQAQTTRLGEELQRVAEQRNSGRVDKASRLHQHPRIERRVQVLRRIAGAFRQLPLLEQVDRQVQATFRHDETLLERAIRHRLSWGNLTSARQLIAELSQPGEQRKRLELLCGTGSAVEGAGAVSVAEAANLVLPRLTRDPEAARSLLERVQLAPDDKAALEHIPLLVGATSFLNVPDLTLTFCRHWIDLAVRHSPGLLYQTVQSILQTGRRSLDRAQLQSLTEHVLGLVIEKPDKFTVFVRRLAQLRDTVGPGFLTRQQIERLIKAQLAANDRFIYGLEQMLMLLAANDRAPVLRGIWNQLPKTQKAYFLIRLAGVLDIDVDQDFAEFLISGFRNSLGESDHKQVMAYQIEQLSMNARVNLELRLRFLDVLATDGTTTSSLAAGRAALLFKLGRHAPARQQLRTVMEAETFSKQGRDAKDPRAKYTYRRLLNSMGTQIHADVMAVFDAIEQTRGRTPDTVRKRLGLLSQLRRRQEVLPILEAAVKEFPDDAKFRSQLANHLASHGAWRRAIAVRQAGLDKKPDSSSLRQQLVADWKHLHHPIRALAIRDGGFPKPAQPSQSDPAVVARPVTPKSVNSAASRKQRHPPASIAAVKQALQGENKDENKALALFRPLWRMFSPVQRDPYSRHSRAAIYGKFGPTGRLIWPPEPKPAKTQASQSRRKAGRGGLAAIFTRRLTKADHAKRRPRVRGNQSTEQQTASSVLVQTAAGRQEIERMLRSLPSSQLGSAIAKDLYRSLIEAAVADASRDVVLQQLLTQERAGKSDKIALGMLSALLEDAATGTVEQIKRHLPSLAANLNPRDPAQVRRLARLYARCGEQARAATLFQWSAVAYSSQSGNPRGYLARPPTDDLLEEIRKSLSGEHRIRALDGVLRLTDPGEYARDIHIAKVLRTWLDLLDAKRCLERSRWALDLATDLKMRPMRSACKTAALVHARGGEVDAARRCLEIALCKLPLPKQTDYPYYLAQFEQPGYLSDYDIAVLFPKDMDDFVDPTSWLAEASTSVLAWHQAKRLSERVTLPLLAVLAIRLADAGQAVRAAELLAPMIEIASDNPDQRLVIADVARQVGQTNRADAILRQLFDVDQLNVERIPELIANTIERDGAAAGLALGEQAIDTTLHPNLLTQLIAAAKKIGDPAKLQRWQDLATDTAAARAKLDPPKKKPAAKDRPAGGEKTTPAARRGR